MYPFLCVALNLFPTFYKLILLLFLSRKDGNEKMRKEKINVKSAVTKLWITIRIICDTLDPRSAPETLIKKHTMRNFN
jgi:hypothetical protein